MFIKLDKADIYFDDSSSKEKRELISNKLVEFNQAQSSQVYQCYQSENEQPDFIEII